MNRAFLRESPINFIEERDAFHASASTNSFVTLILRLVVFPEMGAFDEQSYLNPSN